MGSLPASPNRSESTAVQPRATIRSANPSTIGEMPGISVITTTTGPVPLRYTVWVTPSAVNGYCSNVARSPSGARRRAAESVGSVVPSVMRFLPGSNRQSGRSTDRSVGGRRRRGQPPRLALLRERAGALLLVGMTPHADELLRAGPARVGEPELERTPQRPLGGGHRGRGVAGDRLAQLLGPVPERVRRVHDLADHPELVGPGRVDALVPPHERHPHD